MVKAAGLIFGLDDPFVYCILMRHEVENWFKEWLSIFSKFLQNGVKKEPILKKNLRNRCS
jgi:hypothetical protein